MISPLAKAFKELRKEGWYCAFCLPCCQSCAWDAVPFEHPDGTAIDFKRVLFNHSQDWYSYRMDGCTYLAHGGSKELPHAIEVMTRHGCEVTWDGKKTSRIWVETRSKSTTKKQAQD